MPNEHAEPLKMKRPSCGFELGHFLTSPHGLHHKAFWFRK
jgi:hypothetical protein